MFESTEDHSVLAFKSPTTIDCNPAGIFDALLREEATGEYRKSLANFFTSALPKKPVAPVTKISFIAETLGCE